MNFACENCFFARPNAQQPGTFLCHANPPIPMLVKQGNILGQQQEGIAMLVPVVNPDYYCRLFATVPTEGKPQ